MVEFHNLMKASYQIMTDSGGIQEVAPALGKPVLVMRDTTERPEGVEAGTLKLAGTKMEDIYRECRRLLTEPEIYRRMSEARNKELPGTYHAWVLPDSPFCVLSQRSVCYLLPILSQDDKNHFAPYSVKHQFLYFL